jgi:hypothetical protein
VTQELPEDEVVDMDEVIANDLDDVTEKDVVPSDTPEDDDLQEPEEPRTGAGSLD